MTIPSATLLLMLTLLPLAGCAPAGRDGIEVAEARVRALIPGQDRTAAYFTLHNATAAPVVLTGARCADARAVEMHVTDRDGDMMRMRRLDEVVIAAGDTVRFEPGGRHLMLFGVSSLGDATEIVLQRKQGDDISVRFETMAMGGA